MRKRSRPCRGVVLAQSLLGCFAAERSKVSSRLVSLDGSSLSGPATHHIRTHAQHTRTYSRTHAHSHSYSLLTHCSSGTQRPWPWARWAEPTRRLARW